MRSRNCHNVMSHLKNSAWTLWPMLVLYGSRISIRGAEGAREKCWVVPVSDMRRLRLRLIMTPLTINIHSSSPSSISASSNFQCHSFSCNLFLSVCFRKETIHSSEIFCCCAESNQFVKFKNFGIVVFTKMSQVTTYHLLKLNLRNNALFWIYYRVFHNNLPKITAYCS